jgi:rhodanese-related sulfurtransferase
LLQASISGKGWAAGIRRIIYYCLILQPKICMMKIILGFLLPLLLLHTATLNAQEVKQIGVDEFEKAVGNPAVQVFDVRTAGEYQSGHLKQALQADWNNPQQFKDRAQSLDKTKPIYVYCLSGGRSAAAAAWLQQQGYSNVYSLKGGINAWKQANKAVEGMPNVKQITMEEYKSLIKGNQTYLVDFGAEWCPPCKKMEPILADLKSKAVNKFTLVKIDAAVQTNIMKELNVDALPVFIIYKNGKEVWRKQGLTSLQELESKL